MKQYIAAAALAFLTYCQPTETAYTPSHTASPCLSQEERDRLRAIRSHAMMSEIEEEMRKQDPLVTPIRIGSGVAAFYPTDAYGNSYDPSCTPPAPMPKCIACYGDGGFYTSNTLPCKEPYVTLKESDIMYQVFDFQYKNQYHTYQDCMAAKRTAENPS